MREKSSRKTYQTANSSRQNIKLMMGVTPGPNAFLPMSEYERTRGSCKIIRARILALRKFRQSEQQSCETNTRATHV